MVITLIPNSRSNAQGANTQAAGVPLALDIAPEIYLRPGGGTVLPVRFDAPSGVPRQVVMLVRGMPPGVSLSEGRPFGPGVWAIPPASIGRLKLIADDSAKGSAMVSVALVSLEGATLAEVKSILRIGGVEPPQQDVATTALPNMSSPGGTESMVASARPDPIDEETRDKLVARGDEIMKSGKIAAARLLYQRAAEAGSAEGALALGGTYDTKELARLNVTGGIHADPELARKWYRKASELGSTEAVRRMQQRSN